MRRAAARRLNGGRPGHNCRSNRASVAVKASGYGRFGKEYALVAFAAQQMIAEKYPEKNWDYLQTFSYKGIKFWCIADAEQGEHQEEEHITFLLRTDY